jgi:hypothetical protein
MPFNTPELVIVATDGLLLLHVPPAGVAVIVVEAPAQTVAGVLVMAADEVMVIAREA